MKAFVANRREANNVVLEASLLAGPIPATGSEGNMARDCRAVAPAPRHLGARIGAADTRLAQDAPGNVRSTAPSRSQPLATRRPDHLRPARQPGSDQDHPDRASGTDRCVRRSWRDGETELTSQSRGARTAASTR
jgi:hypothetical protein